MIARAGFLRWVAGSLLIGTGTPGRGAAQGITVRLVGGVLCGIMRDSATGEGVGYAMITIDGTDRRVFTAETGRFALEGLGAGEQRIRALQIGYAAREVVVQIVDQPGAPHLLTIVLARARTGCPTSA